MSVKITIAVCHVEVYCGFQKAAVTGLSHTQADYADMIMLLCILEANNKKKHKTKQNKADPLRSLHFKLVITNEK